MSLLKEGNDILPVLGVLETRKRFFGPRYKRLGVLEVLVQVLLCPYHISVGVCLRVEIKGLCAGLTTDDAVQVRAGLVHPACADGVALVATRHE